MTPEEFQRVRGIFLEARRLARSEREAFVARESGGDERIKAEVDALLAGLDDPADGARMIDVPALGPHARAAVRNAAEVAGAIPGQIGTYRIVRLIGEGAMGRVYEAEQDNPRRCVALKVLHAGVVSGQVIKRFALEAQILGRLHHRGIAQVYEAGVFEDPDRPGRAEPYFAMEFVPGSMLAAFVAGHRPGVRAKLRLMGRICDAVQHAHDRGVVHRDLKPANILVTEDESDDPQPKILDFGVARLTDPDLRLTTMQTGMGQLIGTVAYMSPEQARGEASSIDARSDVYALGVICYELLADRLPYEVGSRPLHEAVRVIQEDTAAPLSRVHTSLRGDLETIVAKALDKEPGRRYASAGAFAEDIRRYLADEPIVARPPTRLYHLRKFARRNRVLVGGLAATLLALAAGTAISTTLYLRAERARAGQAAATGDAKKQARRAQAVNDFILQRMLRSPDPSKEGRDVKVVDVLGKAAASVPGAFAGDPEIEAEVRTALGTTYQGLGEYEAALAQHLEAYKVRERALGPENPETLSAMASVGQAYMDLDRNDEAMHILTEARSRMHGREDDRDPACLDVLGVLGNALQRTGKFQEAEPLLRRVVSAREALSNQPTQELLYAVNILSACLEAQDKLSETVVYQRRFLELARKLNGPEDPSAIVAMVNLGQSLVRLGKPEEAEPMLAEAIKTAERVMGPDHAQVGMMRLNYGHCLGVLHRDAEAEEQLYKAMTSIRAGLGDSAYASEYAMYLYYDFLSTHGQAAKAEPVIRERLEIRKKRGLDHEEAHVEVLGDHARALVRMQSCAQAESEASAAEALARSLYKEGDPRIARVESWKGMALACSGRFGEAETLLLASYKAQKGAEGPPGRDASVTAAALADVYAKTGNAEEAKRWFEAAAGR